jgi:hypothetical protein
MASQEEIETFRAKLEGAGIASSNTRAHRALDAFRDGVPEEKCIAEAVRLETKAREMWLSVALDPWCKRHGITREQGLSIAFADHTYNPANPSKDLVTMKDLFAWAGQQNDFYRHLQRHPAAAGPGGQETKVVVVVQGGGVQYATSNSPDVKLLVHDQDHLGEAATDLLDSVAMGCSQIAYEQSFAYAQRQAALNPETTDPVVVHGDTPGA